MRTASRRRPWPQARSPRHSHAAGAVKDARASLAALVGALVACGGKDGKLDNTAGILNEEPTADGLVEQKIDLNRDGEPDIFNYYKERKDAPRLLVIGSADDVKFNHAASALAIFNQLYGCFLANLRQREGEAVERSSLERGALAASENDCCVIGGGVAVDHHRVEASAHALPPDPIKIV